MLPETYTIIAAAFTKMASASLCSHKLSLRGDNPENLARVWLTCHMMLLNSEQLTRLNTQLSGHDCLMCSTDFS